jgi:hypothetical protein
MLRRGDNTDWEFKFISRPTLPEVLKEFEQIGIRGICHDPDAYVGSLLTEEKDG